MSLVAFPEFGNDPGGGDMDDFPSGDDNEDHQNKIINKIDQSYPEGETCIPTGLLDMFSKEEFDGPGFGPQCAEAAKIILDAVMDDAMNYTEYNELDAVTGTQNVTQGNITEALQGVNNED